MGNNKNILKRVILATLLTSAVWGYNANVMAAPVDEATFNTKIAQLTAKITALETSSAKKGTGQGTTLATNANASKEKDIAIGKGATVGASTAGGGISIGNNARISYSNGPKQGHGDIAIGESANINNYASQGASIAIGRNAKVENMAGGQEANLGMGQTTFTGNGGFFPSAWIPADSDKVVSSVAIGNNTFARSGSVMIGSHNYKGELGDESIDTAKTRDLALNMYATSLGSNSFADGVFSTITGAYSIMTSDYNGGRMADLLGNVKNFGAVINGSFNSIESKTAGGYTAGVANAIVGVANRTNNSNGTLILGAGNEVTNSIENISASGVVTGKKDSAKDFADTLRKVVKDGEGAGGIGIIGGGNKADYALKSQIIGINNELKGVDGNESKFVYMSGYKNILNKVQNTYLLGVENKLTDSSKNVVFGDNHNFTGSTGNVAIGFNDNEITRTNLENALILGNNANVSVNGGVALGAGSIADRAGFSAAKVAPFSNFELNGHTLSAVSIGYGTDDAEMLRQITHVGDGTEDTDAVNVRQLKAVADMITPGGLTADDVRKIIGDAGISVTPNGNLTDNDDVTIGVENGGITTEKIANNAITTEKIQNNAVTTEKIANNSITTEKIQNNAVTTEKIANDSITTEKIQNNAVTTEKIANNSITTEKIGDLQVTENKLSTDVQEKLNQVNDISNDVYNLRDETHSGLAMNAALAALKPLQYRPLEKTQIMAGVGRYKNRNAYALGLAVHSNEDLLWNGGIAFGKGSTLLVNAGVTWRVGTKGNQEVEKPYEKGPISSVKILENKVSLLEKENKAIRQENISMHQQVEQMMKELKSVQEQIEELTGSTVK